MRAAILGSLALAALVATALAKVSIKLLRSAAASAANLTPTTDAQDCTSQSECVGNGDRTTCSASLSGKGECDTSE